jgi:hypothetical protein
MPATMVRVQIGSGSQSPELNTIFLRSVQSDAYWTFAMACNVYLTFYHKYEAVQLRKLEWKYLVFCYGLPCIPAIIFLFIETEERGKVYGSGLVSSEIFDSDNDV